jgi:poly-beta-1,6-N-acetyl-D-glucosamine N-deacetylase
VNFFTVWRLALNFITTSIFGLILCSIAVGCANSAVILQYHHVSEHTPNSTTISPAQFRLHLQTIKQLGYTVVPLTELIEPLKQHQRLPDKTLAITFDDGYQDVLTHAVPILQEFDMPFTIFINPALISASTSQYLSWPQLKQLAQQGVLIANHGYDHHSVIRKANALDDSTWLALQKTLLLQAEQIIQQQLAQTWRYFAYPYGEFEPKMQNLLSELGFVGFSQQSGAMNIGADLTAIPRFPMSYPYDDIANFKLKLQSLALAVTTETSQAPTIFAANTITDANLMLQSRTFEQAALNCYLPGGQKQKIHWVSDRHVQVQFVTPLAAGRIRLNCTAQDSQQLNRYYWYSKVWFIKQADGQWFPL